MLKRLYILVDALLAVLVRCSVPVYLGSVIWWGGASFCSKVDRCVPHSQLLNRLPSKLDGVVSLLLLREKLGPLGVREKGPMHVRRRVSLDVKRPEKLTVRASSCQFFSWLSHVPSQQLGTPL